MRTRRLGKTGLQVSEIGFGSWAIGGNDWGNSYGATDDAVSKAAIQKALELGVTLFDTADVYGQGHSEALLSEVLTEWHGPPPVVVTKGGINFYRKDGTLEPDWTPLALAHAVQQSLIRLRREALDVFLLMNPPVEELDRFRVWETLDALRRAGKIKWYGASVAEPEDGVWLLKNNLPIDVLEVGYSLFYQGATTELLPLARKRKVGILAREPLANGFLTGKYESDVVFPEGDIRASLPPEYVAAMTQTAAQLDFLGQGGVRTAAQAALRFVLDDPAVSSVIVGAKTAWQVEENVGAAVVPPIDAIERARIAQVFLMLKVTSAAQMREMDRRTIEDYGVPSLVLMENAALRVVDVIAERFGPLRGKRIAVVCGKGNNGGDGLAIARHLATRFGADVTIWLTADSAAYSGDAAANYKMAQAFGLTIQQFDFPVVGGGWGLLVDALLGTGIKGGVTGELAEAINGINNSGCPVVSVDVPSGLDADTGKVEGACVKATLTVTFALPKFGLMVYPGAEYVGELVVADIGMPRQVMAANEILVTGTEAADIAQWLPARVNGRDSNKGQFGHVTVFAGSSGFVGAPTLTSEAAARMGAGLVTLAIPEGIQNALMARVSPVVMTKGLAQTDGGTFARSAVEAALKLAAKGTAAALGPGLGGPESEETRAFVREFVARCSVPLVIDADALNCLALEPDRGASVLKERTAGTVLTPHPGEMGRLLGTDTKTVQAERRAAVEQAARDFGCPVLLKGARTLIADPSGRLAINTTSNPGMATGGAGDVLSGVIAALLAGKLDAWESAVMGAYLHGLAGDLVADKQGGPAGLIATDLIDYLPVALAHCHVEAANL